MENAFFKKLTDKEKEMQQVSELKAAQRDRDKDRQPLQQLEKASERVPVQSPSPVKNFAKRAPSEMTTKSRTAEDSSADPNSAANPASLKGHES